MSKLYLFAYNAAQVMGWSIILIKTLHGLCEGLGWRALYENVQLEVEIFQTAALLEIVHSAIGLVRSPLGTTCMQVASRLTLVWPVLHVATSSRHSIGVPMLLCAWSLAEIIRYSYYALSLYNSVPYILTWLRYTMFIVLYPTGVTGELLTLFAGLPEIDREKHLTLEMPNPANIAISCWWLLILASLSYLPGFPQLYIYMIHQRKKVLGTEPEKKKLHLSPTLPVEHLFFPPSAASSTVPSMRQQPCCTLRFYVTWLICTIICSLLYALIVSLALTNKTILSDDTIPPVIPYIVVPSNYNVTLQFNTTQTQGNTSYTGTVLMHFVPISYVDRLFVNKGAKLRIVNYETQAFIAPFNLTMQQNYTLGIDFSGSMNDNAFREIAYDDQNGNTNYAIVFATQKIFTKGLRYVFPCLDSRDYPATLSLVIIHSPTLRALSNYPPQTVQIDPDHSQSFLNTPSPQPPAQFVFALTALPPQPFTYQNITISAFYRSYKVSGISIPRQTQLMDPASLQIGKLDVVVLPTISTVHRPGISLVSEDEAIQDIEARSDFGEDSFDQQGPIAP